MRTLFVAPILAIAVLFVLFGWLAAAPAAAQAEAFAVEVLHGSTVTLVRGEADGSRSEVVTREDPVPAASEEEEEEEGEEPQEVRVEYVQPVVQVYESPTYPAYGFVPTYGFGYPYRKFDRHYGHGHYRGHSVSTLRWESDRRADGRSVRGSHRGRHHGHPGRHGGHPGRHRGHGGPGGHH